MYIHPGSSHLNPSEDQMSTIVGAEKQLAEALDEQWRRAKGGAGGGAGGELEALTKELKSPKRESRKPYEERVGTACYLISGFDWTLYAISPKYILICSALNVGEVTPLLLLRH